MKPIILLSALLLSACSWYGERIPAPNKALSPEGVATQYYTLLGQGACGQLMQLVVENAYANIANDTCNNEALRNDLKGASLEFTNPVTFDAATQSTTVYFDVKYKSGQRTHTGLIMDKVGDDYLVNWEKTARYAGAQ